MKANAMPEARKPDWRNADAKASESTESRSWKAKGEEKPGSKMPSRRFRRRAIVLTCVIGLAIGIGILLSYIKGTRPACLVVIGSGFEHNLLLPHNIHGWNGGVEILKSITDEEETALVSWFRDLFSQRSGIRRTRTVALTDWSETWREISHRINAGDAKEQVILYVSAHGYADENEAYLLRDTLDIKSAEDFLASRVPFSALLSSLKKDVSEEKAIVVILDVCHAQSHWPIGMLQNDFVARLQKKYTDEINGMENLTVICSTSPGQVSWSSDERHMSIFADYVSKGLRGEDKEADESVTASGLFDYVKKHVNEWAKVNRAREQVPIRIGGASDPELVRIVKPPVKKSPDLLQKDDAKKTDPKKDEPIQANPGAKFNPNDLRSTWNAWMMLKKHYAPQVYSPHYWRLYQETLLRYEQLLRAGDPSRKAVALKKKLDLLENEIKTNKGLDKAFECLGNSFPLPHVLGFRPQADFTTKELQVVLTQFKANAKAFKAFTAKSDLERRYWQSRLSRMTLNMQLNTKDFDHESIHHDLKKIQVELDVPQRAAEVHFVKMLQDVDPELAKQRDLIKLALRVRMLAEEAALGLAGESDMSELYAETIFKRMQKQLESIDTIRREGEDRLFGDPKSQSAAARDKLTQAQSGYAKILAEAGQLRKALALRDDLAAELPFYGTALASLPGVDNQSKATIETLRTKAESLGASLAKLTKFIDRADGAPPKLKAIEDDLAYVRDQVRMLSETLRGLGADLQKNWHALDGVLRAPPMAATDKDVDLRIALLVKLRDTSTNLDSGKFREPQTEKPEATVEIQRKLLRGTLKTYEDQIQGAEPRNVDDKVRELYFDQFRKTVDNLGDAENESALQSAVEHSRVLLGYQADQLIDPHRERINPAKRLRHLRTYHLLLGLARRTLDDHWFDPGAKDEPTYFVPVAQAYLASAAKILEPKDAKLIKERDDLKRRLVPAGLTVSGAASRYWTSEISYPLTCTVNAEAGVPAGLPTVWFEVPNGKSKTRETFRDWPPPYEASVTLSETEFVARGKVPVTFHALYRGQHKQTELTVDRPPPSVIVRHTPGPEKVGFAVRMDKVDYGAINIVLDNSGSMRRLHPKKDKDRDAGPGEDSRYSYALKALRQVLDKTLPEETFLSISVFGGKITEPNFVEPPNNPSGKPYQRWQRGRLNNLIADLETRSLNNYSPITKAIIKSLDEGFPPRFENPKLIVVLTDGMDNYSFDREAPNNTAARDRNTVEVAAALEKMRKRHPDTDVVLVCFIDKDDEEYPFAKKQFRPIGDENVIFESDGAKLAKVIQDRIVRPRVRLQHNGIDAKGFDDGREVNFKSDAVLAWRPALERNDYQASIRDSSGPETDVRMSPGHNIFSILKRTENKFLFERGILGLQPEVERNSALKQQKRDWLVTLMNNQHPVGTDSRSQLISFEKTSDLGKLRQIPPGFVWLEVETQAGNKVEQTVEWGSDVVVPAPSYVVDVANWPAGHPKLTAWFWPRPWEDLLDNVKPVIDKRFHIKKFTSHPDDLIEGMRWENRRVSVMTPKGPVEMQKDCLVIRTRYLDGKPVYVGLKEKNDRQRVGSEHRFYERAGKGTACFYDLPVALEEVDIVVIPIARFKEAAVQAEAKVEFTPSESIAIPNIFRNAIIEAIHGK